MSTDERMEKMEGQLARIRWINRCLIACIVLGLGVWFISKTFTTETAWAQSGAKEIRAKRFVLEDENGKVLATLGMGPLGAGLNLWDENGMFGAGLGLDKGGSGLELCDENSNRRVFLSAIKRPTPRGGLTLPTWGPGVRLYNENGSVVWSAP